MSILTLRFYYLMLITVKLSIGLERFILGLLFQLSKLSKFTGNKSNRWLWFIKTKTYLIISRRLRLQQHRSKILRSLREACNCQPADGDQSVVRLDHRLDWLLAGRQTSGRLPGGLSDWNSSICPVHVVPLIRLNWIICVNANKLIVICERYRFLGKFQNIYTTFAAKLQTMRLQ